MHGDETEFSGTQNVKLKIIILLHHIVTVDIHVINSSYNKIKTSSPNGNDRSPESNVPRSICPKTLCSLSPTPMMLHIKFDQDWPTGFRDIQVQKCEIFVTQGQVTPK